MNYFVHDKALVHKGAKIGEGTRIWAFVNIQDGAIIGKGCNICDGSFVEKGAIIGNNVTIKHHVSVFDGVIIEDDVFIGSNIAFINDRYPRSNRDDEWVLEPTRIKRGATLGTNVTVLCGITIGEYAFVGAGSVVTRDVGDYCIVVGNPARFIGYACICGRRLDDKLRCSVCNRQYILYKDTLRITGGKDA